METENGRRMTARSAVADHDTVIKIVEVGQEETAVKKRPSETILFIRMHGISRRTFVIYRRLPYL